MENLLDQQEMHLSQIPNTTTLFVVTFLNYQQVCLCCLPSVVFLF